MSRKHAALTRVKVYIYFILQKYYKRLIISNLQTLFLITPILVKLKTSNPACNIFKRYEQKASIGLQRFYQFFKRRQ